MRSCTKFVDDLLFSSNLIPKLHFAFKKNNIYFFLFDKLNLIFLRKKKKNNIFFFNYYFFFYLKKNIILNFVIAPTFYFFDSKLLIFTFFNVLNLVNASNYNLIFYPKNKNLKNSENLAITNNMAKNIKNYKNITITHAKDIKNFDNLNIFNNCEDIDVAEDSFILDFFKAYNFIFQNKKYDTFNFSQNFKSNNFIVDFEDNIIFENNNFKEDKFVVTKNNKNNNIINSKETKEYMDNQSSIKNKKKDFDFHKNVTTSITYSLYNNNNLHKNNIVSNVNKSFKLINDLLWFFFFIQNIKESLFFILKSCFFEFIFRYSDLKNKVSLFFYETSDLKFLTSSLISNYIIRNLRIGNTLIRIISPLLNHLKKSQFIYKGWKIGCFGRFQRRGRAQHLWFGKKGVPLNTLISCVDFFKSIIRLRNGLCCVKVFIVKANIYIYIF